MPLRRASCWGPPQRAGFLIHEELNTVHEWADLPEWAWIVVASILVFIISRAHEWTTELADRLFDRDFRRAERRIEEAGHEIRRADSVAEIERRLVEAPLKALRLASAAIFRNEEGTLRRSEKHRLGGSASRNPERRRTALSRGGAWRAVPDRRGRARAFLGDLARPVLAVPIGNPRRRFAVAFFSERDSGTDLDGGERELLAALARDAEIAYAQVEQEALLREIERLRGLVGNAARPA